jgi:hypothetical protein
MRKRLERRRLGTGRYIAGAFVTVLAALFAQDVDAQTPCSPLINPPFSTATLSAMQQAMAGGNANALDHASLHGGLGSGLQFPHLIDPHVMPVDPGGVGDAIQHSSRPLPAGLRQWAAQIFRWAGSG